MKIHSIPEARKACAEVAERVLAIDDFFSGFERLFHGSSPSSEVTSHPGRNGNSAMPATFVDRVTAILADATKPMRPKTAVKEYIKRGWPLPGKDGSGDLYNNVIGTLLYLRKHKKIVDRNDDGYFLKNSQVAKNLKLL